MKNAVTKFSVQSAVAKFKSVAAMTCIAGVGAMIGGAIGVMASMGTDEPVYSGMATGAVSGAFVFLHRYIAPLNSFQETVLAPALCASFPQLYLMSKASAFTGLAASREAMVLGVNTILANAIVPVLADISGPNRCDFG